MPSSPRHRPLAKHTRRNMMVWRGPRKGQQPQEEAAEWKDKQDDTKEKKGKQEKEEEEEEKTAQTFQICDLHHQMVRVRA